MTEPFHTRAAEIIAAYGGDPARWPDAERATALHVVAASSALTAALAEAQTLDADLKVWALAPVSGVAPANADDAARIARRRPQPFARWAAGTGLAAVLAAGLLFLGPAHRPATTSVAITSRPVTDDASAFAQVFTPTPDEEQVL